MATVTSEMGVCLSLGWATQVFIKGHSSLLSKQAQTASDFTSRIQLASNEKNKRKKKKKNIPQYVFIGPLPLLVCTQEVQCEDALPSTRPQIVSVAAVLGERQVGSRSEIRQCFRDQLVDVTGGILGRQREIRNIIPPKFASFTHRPIRKTWIHRFPCQEC